MPKVMMVLGDGPLGGDQSREQSPGERDRSLIKQARRAPQPLRHVRAQQEGSDGELRGPRNVTTLDLDLGLSSLQNQEK